MNKVTLSINGKQIEAAEGSTILQAAKSAGIYIPTMCYHDDLKPEGVCRICSVEVEGQRTLVAACVYPAAEGMVVKTHSPKVRQARKTILELMLANHPQDCLTCAKSQKCELQALSQELGIKELPFRGERMICELDDSNPSIIRNAEKCILCRRCLRVCTDIQSVGELFANNRGWETEIAPAYGNSLDCVFCGQCINRCPTGALKANDPAPEVWKAIVDSDKHVVVQTAPAVRAAIGEEFGMPPGSLVTGKMVTALRMLGFDKVFDTDFTADLTILEEGNELLQRLKTGGVLPMITSCSPGWINFIEKFYPEQLPHLSTCKSPQQMFGALAKTYYAEKMGIDPAKIVVVSIMPCSAKKFECERPEMASSGYQDVDYVLTTREVAGMIKEAGIDFVNLDNSDFDLPLGMSTGAAVIFGASGGVMEAALRTVYEVVTGNKLDDVNIKAVRGLEGCREAEIDLNGTKVKAAVANGLTNARKLLDMIREGKADYQFIEIMACPGGCLGGGGQPFPTNPEIRAKRAEAIYQQDRELPIRKSHENPVVLELYKEFLIEPLGHKSHELLHTHYTAKTKKCKAPKVEAK
jgi:NADH-quinone oxidoreductase subunit G/NADP-reducing hydrogenase subunit HndD